MSNCAAPRLAKVAEADFPTQFGRFRIYGFEGGAGDHAEEAIALAMGSLPDGPPPLVRIHSQCLTGDVFHSLRCDCRAQLEIALKSIAREGRGLLIYERQEGRGIGLLNKLRAYELQDQGADTVEANERLGFEPDLRSYELPAAVLGYFGLRSVRLEQPGKSRGRGERGNRSGRTGALSGRGPRHQRSLSADKEREDGPSSG